LSPLITCVHRLEDQQHGPAIVRVETLLERDEPLDAAREPVGGALLVLDAAGVARIVAAQIDLLSRADAVAVGVHP
jgi:hypothetical protein